MECPRDLFWDPCSLIFINDLDEEVEGWVDKFADDTKVGSVVDIVEGCQQLQ